MKIAVEFYGHIRTFKDTINSIVENFIEPLGDEVDIFIHCWDYTDHSDITWHNMECEHRGRQVSDDDLNFLNTKLHPKKILCESQLNFADSTKTFFVNEKNTPYKQIKNMYYTRFKANELRKEYEIENNIKYDYVFQARLDLIFNSKMNFLSIYNNEIQHRINDIDNIIFYSWTGDNKFFNTPQLSRGGTDILYFGSPNAMNKLCNLYENLDFIDLNTKCKFFDYFWLYNAIRQSMEIASFNFYLGKDYNILRTKEALDCINKHKTNKLKNFINDFKLILYAFLFLGACVPIIHIFLNKKKYYKKIQKYMSL